MPVYEYRCSSGHGYEKTEGFDAPTVQSCPDCGAEARRQLSLPAVIFKGSGFYSTDNRRSGGRTNGSSASSDGGDTGNGHGHSHDDGHGHSHGTGAGAGETAA